MKSEKEIRQELHRLTALTAMYQIDAMNADEIETPDEHWIDRHNRNFAMMMSTRYRLWGLRWVLGIDPEE